MSGISVEPAPSVESGEEAGGRPLRTDFVAHLSRTWGLPKSSVVKALAHWIAEYEPGPRALEMAERCRRHAAA